MFAIRKFSKRESIIACAVALVIAAAVIYNLAIEPLALRRRQLDSQLKRKAYDFSKAAKFLSYKVSESDYARFSTYAAGAKKNEEEDTSDTLRLIESLSREDSCLISSIRPGSVKTSGRVKEITIDIDIEAPLESLAKFFYDIEARPDMALRISRFTINSTTGKGTVKCALSIGRILLI